MNAVAVLLKPVELAKTRLQAWLTPRQRATLAYAMLEDVLRAVSLARQPEITWLVTQDDRAAQVGESLGFRVCDEGQVGGMNQAASRVVTRSLALGVRRLLVLPADIPLVTAADVDAFFALPSKVQVAFCACRRGSGTNALYLSPPDVISPRFGLQSCRAHEEACIHAGLVYCRMDHPRVALDVDDVDDLCAVARAESGLRTQMWMRKEARFLPWLGARDEVC